MSLLAVSGLLEGPSTEHRQKHSKFPEGGGHLFIDHVILYKETNITKTEHVRGFGSFCQQRGT